MRGGMQLLLIVGKLITFGQNRPRFSDTREGRTVVTCAGGSAVCTYFTKKFPSFYPVRFLGLPCPRAAQSLLVYGPHAWAACAEALSFRNRTRFQTRILLDFEVPVFLKAAMLFGFSNEKEFLPDNGLPTDVFWL